MGKDIGAFIPSARLRDCFSSQLASMLGLALDRAAACTF